MSRPGEAIELDDFDADDEYIIDDDEYEDTVGDTTGAVGGTPAYTDFGGGQIKTPARRGSIEWETKRDANISSESQYSIQDLNDQLNKLKYSDDSPSLRRTIQTLERQKSELARDEFYDYVLKRIRIHTTRNVFCSRSGFFGRRLWTNQS